MTGKFWMLFVEGSNGFTYRHETPEAAETEAERLARMPSNSNKKVFVLESIEYCQTEPIVPPVVFHEILWANRNKEVKDE